MVEIKIKSIDTDNIEKDNSFEKAYAFYIFLNTEPDYIWQKIFEHNRKGSLYLGKRKITIQQDKLRLVTSDEDNTKGQVDFAKKLIEETNRDYKNHKEREVKKEEQRKVELSKIEKTKENLKNKLKDIKI